ncbi:hypothetical protein PGTUg99_031568 [Puccinia graminis f. sp. tritici]|uniref:UDENN domain-containing protein n=1 Tax=Puccinia graminis f. sp. tritici TaxID=56615 RepID=A0A5B0P5G7_PUCGR|nr:hypothetical protein PGTUg99_031568 [Puccinia graminis f. sp. tritici]
MKTLPKLPLQPPNSHHATTTTQHRLPLLPDSPTTPCLPSSTRTMYSFNSTKPLENNERTTTTSSSTTTTTKTTSSTTTKTRRERSTTSPLSPSASRRHPSQKHHHSHSNSQDITSLSLSSSPPPRPPPLPASLPPTKGSLPSPLQNQPPNIPPILKQTLAVPDLHSLDHHALAAASRWILTFALINFDLDEGPDFDNCYPPVQFTPSQMSNIAFSSFPDCAKSGSLIFSWRIPASSSFPSTPNTATNTANNRIPAPPGSYSSAKPTLKLTSPSPDLSQPPFTLTKPTPSSDMCGYVYFVQERDPSVLRGYNQRSLVLITHLSDYVGLFSTLVSRLGPLYASQGPKSLETAFQNIMSWPDPTPGAELELTFLGQDHKFIIPLPNQAQIPDPKTNFPLLKAASGSLTGPQSLQYMNPLDYHVLASNPTTYLSYILFGSNPNTSSSSSSPASSALNSSAVSTLSVSDLWLLWEILILGEPLVVFGATPDIVSDTILHLKNLIRPIPFHANWRPYITIHDPDFGLLFGKNKSRAVGLIGATNPIILTATHAWPNVLSLSKQGASLNHHIGLLTDRKRVLHKNKSVVKQLLLCLERKDYHHADIVISRHFSVLTEQFLQPLQRYFTTLLPTAEGTGTEPRRTGTFNSELFLKSLKEHTTALEFRSRLMTGFTASSVSAPGFYTAFLRSPNFSAWLHRQLVLGNRAVRDRFFSNSNQLNKQPKSRPVSFSHSEELNDIDIPSVNSLPPFVSNDPFQQVIKKLHNQLSKKPVPTGLPPIPPTGQPIEGPTERSKKEYPKVGEGSPSGGSQGHSHSYNNNQRSPSEGGVLLSSKKNTPGLGLQGLKKSRTIGGGARAGGEGGGGDGGGERKMRRSSSTMSNASSSNTTSSSLTSRRKPEGLDGQPADDGLSGHTNSRRSRRRRPDSLHSSASPTTGGSSSPTSLSRPELADSAAVHHLSYPNPAPFDHSHPSDNRPLRSSSHPYPNLPDHHPHPVAVNDSLISLSHPQ